VIDSLLPLSRPELRARFAAGRAVDPQALAGWAYLGVSLGLPRWVERLSWKTFVKAFHAEHQGGGLRGWNLRLRQAGLNGPHEALLRGGVPWTFGHYRVVQEEAGLLIDYGRGANAALDPTRLLRDPLVSLDDGACDLLLGTSLVQIGPWRVPTPSWFLLQRLRRLEAAEVEAAIR
jgi:hypothetical protein